MTDDDCIEFLHWCLPKLKLRWAGFRKVRKQVCKRVARRMRDLALPDKSAYKLYLDSHPDEWKELDLLCRITISRFYRDRKIFDYISHRILPEAAMHANESGEKKVKCWSIGCGAGEEVYTLKVIWKKYIEVTVQQAVKFEVIGTDIDPHLLEMAKAGLYRSSTLKDLPVELRQTAFEVMGEYCSIKPQYMDGVEFSLQDIREDYPAGYFHIILCRNLVFTYFEKALQEEILEKITKKLLEGGILVIGIHEYLPVAMDSLVPIKEARCIYRKSDI